MYKPQISSQKFPKKAAPLLVALFFAILVLIIYQSSSHKQNAAPLASPPASKSLFRNILEEKCHLISEPTSGAKFISVEKLPFTIDQKIVKLPPMWKNPDTENKLTCQENYGIAIAYIGGIGQVWISDDKKELPDSRKKPGPSIGKKDDTDFFIKLVLPSGGIQEGHGAPINSLWVEIYGTREIKLKNGEPILLSYDENGITPPDQRLSSLLKKYATPKTVSTSYPELDLEKFSIESIETDIAKTFFSDLNNLDPKEAKVVDKIYQVLHAFNP